MGHADNLNETFVQTCGCQAVLHDVSQKHQNMKKPNLSLKMGFSRMSKGQLTASVIKDHVETGAIVTGLLPSVKYLESISEALLCIIADDSSIAADITAHIHTILLKAFCLECEIPVLTVDSSEKLMKLLGISETSPEAKHAPFICVLTPKRQDASSSSVTEANSWKNILLEEDCIVELPD